MLKEEAVSKVVEPSLSFLGPATRTIFPLAICKIKV